LEGLVVLTLSILGGTRLSTLTNAVVIFMLYGLAFIAGWIEQIGSFLRSEAAVNIGIIISLLIPSEAMWKRAAYLMQPSFLRELGLQAAPSAQPQPQPGDGLLHHWLPRSRCWWQVRWFQRRDLWRLT
jgi:hypothetical protein